MTRCPQRISPFSMRLSVTRGLLVRCEVDLSRLYRSSGCCAALKEALKSSSAARAIYLRLAACSPRVSSKHSSSASLSTHRVLTRPLRFSHFLQRAATAGTCPSPPGHRPDGPRAVANAAAAAASSPAVRARPPPARTSCPTGSSCLLRCAVLPRPRAPCLCSSLLSTLARWQTTAASGGAGSRGSAPASFSTGELIPQPTQRPF